MHVAGRVVFWVALLAPAAAHADDKRELIVPFHEGGHLVFDQLSGLKVDGAGATYEGPIGASYRKEKIDGVSDVKTTSIWFAPTADVFVTDHLSLGGSFEYRHTWGDNGKYDTLTALPRIGFYAPFGDRFGVWPRLGIGYTKSDAYESVLIDVNVSLIYRFTEQFFVRVGPDLGMTLGGTASNGADASVLSISGVAALGINLEL